MNIHFVKYSKFFHAFSILLAVLSVIFLVVFKLHMGIDFAAGTIMEFNFEQRPYNQVIEKKLSPLNLGGIDIQPIGVKGVIIRVKEINNETHQAVISKLNEISKVEEMRFESISPVVGKELRQKTLVLIFVSLVALLVYIAISFKNVSKPISSWQYGLVSIIALSFDILITLGIFSLLGKFYNVQFNIPIVTALLTILGYTINDKVIVFDRIRENLLRDHRLDFKSIVDESLNQTIGRSISTGSCTLLVLFSLFFLGGEALKYFSLTLIVGILIGTYSSLFLASFLLISRLKVSK